MSGSNQNYSHDAAFNGVATDEAKNLAILVYALQAAAYVVGFTFFAAVVINYIKFDDVRGTWLESHFRWQINTFWYSLLWCAVGWLTVWIFIGFVIWGISFIWVIYRIAKGWLYLADGKPMCRYY